MRQSIHARNLDSELFENGTSQHSQPMHTKPCNRSDKLRQAQANLKVELDMMRQPHMSQSPHLPMAGASNGRCTLTMYAAVR